MFLAAATRLDRYEVISLLGTGGMGEVYLVRDTKLDRRVALKLVSSTVAADADRMRRFIGEAKAASALNHPNILVVHEIGESAGRPFIVTEFIEGVTLRQRLGDGPFSLPAALDVAVQVASALAAAHAAGIVHRDIKPENIMIRPDGVVKVLDFGLARVVVQEESSVTLVTDPPARAEAETVAGDLTRAGLMLGTTRYMSPEQARGQDVDARSDVFSCGAVLYEMLAGRSPFAADTISDTIAALLRSDPPAIDQYLPDTPHELQRILDQALAKPRDQRYSSAKEFWADLVALRRAVEFGPVPLRAGESNAAKTFTSDRRVRRGGVINTLKRHAFAGIAATVLLAIAAVMFRSYSNRPAALTDKDTILIADFVNATGDEAFDAALKQGLAVQLSQSPFLSIFPEARTRETLRLMGRSADDPVTPEVAREIGQRQGLKAFIAGSIRKFDRNYSITLEALASLTGEPLALAQSEAVGRDEVLKALSRAATELRERLGESLGTIEAFDAPLELTTSSLDALQAFALGEQEAHRGDYRSAIAFFQRAVELDPEFAYGWAKLAVHHMNTRQPALATEFATRAFALRHRVSELERLRISSFYSFFVDGDVDEGVKLVERYQRTYPRDGLAATNIASGHIVLGQFDRAIPAARTALLLTPGQASALSDLAIALLATGNVTEARDAARQALGQKIDSADLRSVLYFTGFVLGDTAVMQQQLDWAKGRADEHVAFDWQARTAAARGRLDAAAAFTRRAVTLAAQTGAKELAARYTAEHALRAAAFGDCPRIKPATSEALALDRGSVPLTRSALALAMCGQADAAQPLLDELTARYPKATLVNTLWIPTTLAAIEVERGNGDRGKEVLAHIRFEGAGERWPQYVRARALALERNWSKAVAELGELVADRGQVPFSPIGGLAYLRLAQVASESGDRHEARGHYARLFDYWSDADPKLPVLLRARAAYARLPQ